MASPEDATAQDGQMSYRAASRTTRTSPPVLSPTVMSTSRQQQLADSTGEVEGQGSHLARATALLARTPSPFYRSMVEAADRVASGPVLDLAGSLGAESLRDGTARNAPSSTQDLNNFSSDMSERFADYSRSIPRRNGESVADHMLRSEHARERQLHWDMLEERLASSHRERTEAIQRQSRNERPVHVEMITGHPEDAIQNGHSDPPGLGVTELGQQRNSSTAIHGNTDLETSNNEHNLSRFPRERGAEFRNTLEHLARGYRITRRTLRTTSTQVAQPAVPAVPAADHQTSSDRWPRFSEQTRTTNRENWVERQRLTGESISSPGDYNRVARRDVTANLGDDLTTDASSRREENSLRSVPTAAALRAARHSWNLDASRISDNAVNQSSISQSGGTELTARTRDALDAFALQHGSRLEGLQAYNRFRAARDRLVEQLSDDQAVGLAVQRANGQYETTNAEGTQREGSSLAETAAASTVDAQPQVNPASEKAIHHLCYLTKLKDVGDEGSGAIALARQLGLDSIRDSLISERVCDLPMRIEELPGPEITSWLEPAMGWSGEQSGGIRTKRETRSFTSGILFARTGEDGMSRMLSLRARRQREQLRDRMSLLGGALGPPRLSGLSRAEEELVFADMERNLNDFVENGQESGHDSDWNIFVPQGRNHTDRNALTMVVEERWPVKVTLHSVDWTKLTLTGTMTAINIPDRSRPRSSAPHNEKEENTESSSMESLFDGEIIDFRLHELETVIDKKGYTVGGPAIDVRYWAGVGPFRVAVECEKRSRRDRKRNNDPTLVGSRSSNEDDYDAGIGLPKRFDRDLSHGLSHSPTRGTKDQILTKDEEDEITDEVMCKCLGSQKWIQDNLKQWILMRWKERCFVATPGPNFSSGASSSSPHTRRASSTYTPSQDATWGLTISGFYYVALHRQTGRIEGLYYDPASQPYQRLEMRPKDQDPFIGRTALKNVGIRKEFPVFELR